MIGIVTDYMGMVYMIALLHTDRVLYVQDMEDWQGQEGVRVYLHIQDLELDQCTIIHMDLVIEIIIFIDRMDYLFSK